MDLSKKFHCTLIMFMLQVERQHCFYMQKYFPDNEWERLDYKVNRKYIRLYRGDTCFGFVDKDGNIYKSDTWTKPAKHIRGNIFSKQNGMEAISQTDNGEEIHPHIKYLK